MVTTSAAVAWGKPIIAENEIKEQKYISLSSIMDETLALKLQDSSEGTPWTNQNVIIQIIVILEFN